MIQFDDHIFQMGWFNHQPVVLSSMFFWGGSSVNHFEPFGESVKSCRQAPFFLVIFFRQVEGRNWLRKAMDEQTDGG